jgi:hypothetical protein
MSITKWGPVTPTTEATTPGSTSETISTEGPSNSTETITPSNSTETPDPGNSTETTSPSNSTDTVSPVSSSETTTMWIITPGAGASNTFVFGDVTVEQSDERWRPVNDSSPFRQIQCDPRPIPHKQGFIYEIEIMFEGSAPVIELYFDVSIFGGYRT